MRKLGLFLIALFVVFMVNPTAHADIEIQVEDINTTSVEKKSTGTVSFQIQVRARNLDVEDSGADITLQAVDKTGNKLIKIKVKGSIYGQTYSILSKKISMPVKDYEAIEKWTVTSIDAW